MTPYRLGLDLGTNSVGWAAICIDKDGNPTRLLDMGARLFHNGRNPKTNASLAEPRRLARGTRRNRDRYLQRRRKLMNGLIRYGLMPEDEAERKALEKLDPYELRARGVEEKLTLHELGRAFFHLNQRRGFKSNRKTDKAADDDSGKVKTANKVLETAIQEAGAKTLGQYLYSLHKDNKSVRARLLGEGAKAEYSLYPTRAMVEAEFDALWDQQRKYHSDLLTEEARTYLRDAIFWQRKLKVPEVGQCRHRSEQKRAPKALPTSQRFRILKELNNLRLKRIGEKDRPLTLDQRNHLLKRMLGKKMLTFKEMRNLLGLEGDVLFNLESDRREGLDGDLTAMRMKSAFGKDWFALPLARQDEIIQKLLDEEDEQVLIAWLRDNCNLSTEAAEKVAGTPLPEGHMAFCKTLMDDLLPILEKGIGENWIDPDSGEVITPPVLEHMALNQLGYHHSDHSPTAFVQRLPYYGILLTDHLLRTDNPRDKQPKRYGCVTNPTVHIGLNQVREVVNTLSKQYGPPAEIVVELARELKLSKKEKDAITKEQKINQDRNKAYDEILSKEVASPKRDDRLRMRLYEEQGNVCPYCLKTIGGVSALTNSDVEIEHILPFRRTLDNSPANKVVAHRACNRVKGNLSPAEAFKGEMYEKILAHTRSLPRNKHWRFEPDAMERYENKERDFLTRQLSDTQYLARWTKEYLSHLAGVQVWVTPGRLTEMLRRRWGLNHLLGDENRKNRNDHRHQALDGFVVALTTRSMLKRVADAAEESGNGRERAVKTILDPWDGFREELRQRLDTVVMAHRPDHGIQGRLHEDTAYGLVHEPHLLEEGYNLVRRKPLTSLTIGEVKRIRDDAIRERLQNHIAKSLDMEWDDILKSKPPIKLIDTLKEFSEATGIRRVRLLEKNESCLKIVNRKTKQPYKAVIPGDNHHVDIIATTDGNWKMVGITVFDVNQKEYQNQVKNKQESWRKINPEAKLVMRIHKGDMLEVDSEGKREIFTIYRLEVSDNRIKMAPHREGGQLGDRHKDGDDPFRWNQITVSGLQKAKACPVKVSPTGQVMHLPSLEA